FVKYQLTLETIEVVLLYLRSKLHTSHSSQELYLVEETESFIIDPSNLICCLNVWLQDQPVLPKVDFFVNKILYNYNGRWKLHSIKLHHQHPSERVPIRKPTNSNMP
ncbi:10517_t:CDS:2, partial [Ambispora leptoticha]